MSEQAGLMSTDVTPSGTFQARGSLPTSLRQEAAEMIERLSAVSPRSIVSTKVKVRWDQERSLDQAAIGQASLRTADRRIRSQAAGANPSDVMKTLGSALATKLDLFDGERRPRSLTRPPARPEYQRRPTSERLVVRRKTYSPTEHFTVAEALFDMGCLDYRFFIFTDDADDQTSVIYESDRGPALHRADGSRPTGSVESNVYLNETTAPSISIADAVSRMNSSNDDFIFFWDRDRDRPGVVYRRYDGHYGLLVPSSIV